MTNNNIKFFHIRCPLNKYTFSIKPIRNFVQDNCSGLVLNLFAGKTKLDILEIRNDIDSNSLAEHHVDAFDFVLNYSGEKFGTIILDPPYSYRKSMEFYNGNKNSRFKLLKDNLSRILIVGGNVITFGYQSVSMGTNRGFVVRKICLFSHGGAIHDTIATIEEKINDK